MEKMRAYCFQKTQIGALMRTRGKAFAEKNAEYLETLCARLGGEVAVK